MPDNKIKISGLGSMVLTDQEKIEPEKEYLISLRAELKKIEKNIEDKDEPFYTFVMEYLNTELVQRIGDSRKLKIKHGKTDSQNLRWFIESVGRVKGLDPKEFYHSEMLKKIEEYAIQLDD